MLKKYHFIYLFLFCVKLSFGQIDTTFVDDKYFEDQFYLSIDYNGLVKHPDGFLTNSMSGGVALGYMRDIPLNKRRNVGLGVGLGYSLRSYRHNLKVSESLGESVFEVIPYDEFDTNKWLIQMVEMPIHFRWRTSTATKYTFWRVYAGMKLGYVISSRSEFKGNSGEFMYHGIHAIEKFQYGLSFSAGYGSINASFYYGLNNMFKAGSNTTTGNPIELRQINAGLIFYIL
ncbi:MAG: PorT family protein [Flavobacteriaceae bacterium]|nr:PorT family protein [Flavobacteriaceae bacterium]